MSKTMAEAKTKKPDTCVMIFERNVINKDDYTTVYSYTPIGVVGGRITDKENLIFSTKTVKALEGVENQNYDEETGDYSFPILSDSICTDDKYVYGFPVKLTKLKTLTKTRKEMYDFIHDLKDYQIVQSLSRDGVYNKVFLIYGNNKLTIDDSDYYDFFEMFYGTCVDKIDEAMEKLREDGKISTPAPAVIKKPSNILYSDDIYGLLSDTIICQDDQLKGVATVIAKNSRITNPALKTSLLICGPTGCGKTEIFRTLRDKGNIPIVIEDAGEYSATSFQGKNVTEMCAHLIKAADGDVEKAQHGVIAVDETDKKATQGEQHDSYTTAVIDNLLPMIEGHQYNVPIDRNNEVKFDTSAVTFAFLGAFSGIEKYAQNGRQIGFQTMAEQEARVKAMYNDKSIQKYGLKPEFVGRCALLALNQLNEEDFIRIIKTSDKSQLILFRDLLKSMGIDFKYDEKTIEAIAKKAADLKLGARSIKKIIEDALSVVSYYVFARNSYRELIISPETIEDPNSYILR